MSIKPTGNASPNTNLFEQKITGMRMIIIKLKKFLKTPYSASSGFEYLIFLMRFYFAVNQRFLSKERLGMNLIWGDLFSHCEHLLRCSLFCKMEVTL